MGTPDNIPANASNPFNFVWFVVIVSFVFLSALALFLWYIHYYKKANTSKNKTYILKIEDMSESDKEKYLKR